MSNERAQASVILSANATPVTSLSAHSTPTVFASLDSSDLVLTCTHKKTSFAHLFVRAMYASCRSSVSFALGDTRAVTTTPQMYRAPLNVASRTYLYADMEGIRPTLIFGEGSDHSNRGEICRAYQYDKRGTPAPCSSNLRY
jgi:hypothetical protein